jgi:ABC-type microcin C transport system permease subunit YejE
MNKTNSVVLCIGLILIGGGVGLLCGLTLPFPHSLIAGMTLGAVIGWFGANL